jgi:hypothetical protein
MALTSRHKLPYDLWSVIALQTDKAFPVTARKKTKQDNPEQSKRFIDMAREVGVDERPEAFDAVFKKVIKPKPPARSSSATATHGASSDALKS